MDWFKWFKPKTQPQTLTIEPSVELKSSLQMVSFRENMWVMTPQGVGILFKIGQPCDIHLVNETTGETIKNINFLISDLRQARFHEIPASRQGISKEKATALGYL
jgi:hypothetical protein